MIHRSRRPATLPARRGMRAPWLRRRVPHVAIDPADAAAAGIADARVEEPGAASPGAPGTDGAGPVDSAPIIAPVRPVHGHPTF